MPGMGNFPGEGKGRCRVRARVDPCRGRARRPKHGSMLTGKLEPQSMLDRLLVMTGLPTSIGVGLVTSPAAMPLSMRRCWGVGGATTFANRCSTMESPSSTLL